MATTFCSAAGTASCLAAARTASRASAPAATVARPAFFGARQQLARGTPAVVARPASCAPMTTAAAASIYDFNVQSIDGQDIKFESFKNKVLLVVNVASQCGFTPQYKDLEALQSKFGPKGFTVVAFPCNQFGGQEPGSNSQIKSFAERQGATFPIFAKTDVNGPGQSPLWAFLKKQQGGLLSSDIKWNFTKFLVDRQGNVVGRYAPTTNPLDIESDIQKYL